MTTYAELARTERLQSRILEGLERELRCEPSGMRREGLRHQQRRCGESLVEVRRRLDGLSLERDVTGFEGEGGRCGS